MVSLMFRMDLPIFESRRQGPAAASKAKLLEQVRAQAEDAKRRHVAEIRTSIVDWEISRERLERHERELVPLAEERARATAAGYEGGRVDLAAALEARRGVIEAKLAALNAELELARAWAQLAFLVPERKQP
jgi:outer membrane protein TolC